LNVLTQNDPKSTELSHGHLKQDKLYNEDQRDKLVSLELQVKNQWLEVGRGSYQCRAVRSTVRRCYQATTSEDLVIAVAICIVCRLVSYNHL
jgi:hypothetical protein